VLFGGAVGDQSKKLLPELFRFANTEGTDEIHLIMEFPRGQKWRSLISPRDNRVIVHCDYSNSRLTVLEDFHTAVDAKQEDIGLLVIAGLHLLEREDPPYRTNRLSAVVNRIQGLNPQITLHLELASIADISFLTELANTIFPFVDSLGLNEQELGFLYYSLQGGQDYDIEKIKKDFKDPSLETIIHTISFVIENISKLYKPNTEHRFSRIHFHSLKFHIVAQLKDSRWESGRISVAAGSLKASIQSCSFDKNKHDPEEMFMLLVDESSKSFKDSDPVLYHLENNVEYYIVPVLVCKSPSKTVGLGDAISSSGLIYHQRRRKTS